MTDIVRPLDFAPKGLFLAGLAALGLSLAGATWTALAPAFDAPPRVYAPAAIGDPSGDWARIPLFGTPAPGSGVAPGADAVAVALKLNGTMTGSGGLALISVGGQPAKAFRRGEEIQPGYRLAAIHARDVEIVGPDGRAVLAMEKPGADTQAGAVGPGIPSPGALSGGARAPYAPVPPAPGQAAGGFGPLGNPLAPPAGNPSGQSAQSFTAPGGQSPGAG